MDTILVFEKKKTTKILKQRRNSNASTTKIIWKHEKIWSLSKLENIVYHIVVYCSVIVCMKKYLEFPINEYVYVFIKCLTNTMYCSFITVQRLINNIFVHFILDSIYKIEKKTTTIRFVRRNVAYKLLIHSACTRRFTYMV